MTKDVSVPLESRVVAAIVKKINSLPGCRIKKFHGSPMGAMELDLYGVITRPGEALPRPVFLEVKRPGGKPNPRQTKEIDTWAKLGAVTGYATSVQEALQVLGLN